MGHLIDISFLGTIKGIWIYAIKPLWWLWILALAVGLLKPSIDYLFKRLERPKK